MNTRIPTYSICNLLGADRCMSEFVVTGLGEYVKNHAGLVFPHRHDFFQIVLFTAGSGRHSIDFQQHEVKPGQLYCMMPGQVHSWEFAPDADGFLVNFNESFITSMCHNSHFLYDFPMFNNLSGQVVSHFSAPVAALLESHFQQMWDEYRTYHGEFKNDLMRALLLQLLIRIARNIDTAPTDHVSKHNLTVLRNYQKLIEQHYRALRLPKDYADLMYITPNHLNAICNATTGKAAGELIRARVLLEAKRMLVNAEYSIAEVGYQLDFKDNAYFSRFFKKYTGVAPEEFRKSGGNAAAVLPAALATERSAGGAGAAAMKTVY